MRAQNKVVAPRCASIPPLVDAFALGVQNLRNRNRSDEMTEVTVDLPEELAEAIEQRAAALGTSADQWLSLVIADVVADVPEEGDGPDDWICR
jgi:hypothetical protein